MIWPFRPSPRRILVKAEREFAFAYAYHKSATARQNCQEMGRAAARLRAARNNLIAAQNAMNAPSGHRGVVA